MPDVKPLKIGTAPVAVEEFGSGDTIPAASVSGLGTMATQAAADYVTLATGQTITGSKTFDSNDTFPVAIGGAGGTTQMAFGNPSGVPTINAYTAVFASTTLQLQSTGDLTSIGGALNVGGNTAVTGAVSASTNVSAGGAVSVAGNIHGGNSTFATSFNAGSSRLSHLPGSPVSVRQEFGTDGTGWQYRIATNNSGTVVDRVTVTDGGNVGIGTTSPADSIGFGRALDVQSSTGAAVYVRDSDVGSSSYGFFGADTSRAYVGTFGSGYVLQIWAEGGARATASAAGLAVTGASTATTTVEAGKSLLVTDVYQITAVSTAGQTRTVDLANSAVQTLSANQDFTLNASGPAGKAGFVSFFVYNSGGAILTVIAGTGWFGSPAGVGVPAGNTAHIPYFWDGMRMTLLATNASQSGDLRPT